jgi:sodium-dependent dicarboxylate transporter 2/3/5
MDDMSEAVSAWWRYTRQPQRRWLWYLAAAAVYGVVLWLPLHGFTMDGKRALGVAGVAAFLWVTNVVPSAITGVVVLFLLPFTGVLTNEDTYAYFGNHAVFLVLGAFILVSPVMRSGLSTRIALWAVATFGRSPATLVTSVLWITALLSFVVSEHAVAAMLFPIVVEIVRSTGARPGQRFGLAAFLALSWGAAIGGTATILGGARAPLAMGILENTTGDKISFLQWTLWCIPTVLILMLVGHAILTWMSRSGDISLEAARQFLEDRTAQLGPISSREKQIAGIMVITILLWITQGTTWGLDTIAFFGVLLAFGLRVANWREVEEDVNWGVFVMYGSAIALSAALRDSGAASSLAQWLLDADLESKTLVFAIVVFMSMSLTEIMSNAASVAVLMPIALVIGDSYGISPVAMTIGVAFPAGLAFMIPVSTPAIAIVMTSSYVHAPQVFLRGIVLKVISFVVFMIVVTLYWPVTGLSLF